MISKAAIKSLVNETEAKYVECWETLAGLRDPKISKDERFAKDVFDFQSKLAYALYNLSETYRLLHQEKREVVAKKQRLTPIWFKNRLRLIAKYQQTLKTMSSLGKRLGDSFAWLFYESNRDLLSEHFKQQAQLHAPPGIGGLGELKYIEGFKLIDGHIVLYHGITTFLRVGDVSFINLKNRSVAAIAELKTTKVPENKLDIHMNAIASIREALLFLENQEVEQDDSDSTHPPVTLPQQMQARLDKQIVSMGDTLSVSSPEERVDLDGDYWARDLEALCKELTASAFTLRKVDDGLLLFGIRSTKRSLSSKLLEDTKVDFSNKLQDITEEMQSIADNDHGNDNEVWLGQIYDPKRDYKLTAGMVPLFWWSIDIDVIREIFFYDAIVLHLYNPAYLAAKLRLAGFQVESIEGQRGFKVQKKSANGVLKLESFDYFADLVISNFWYDDSIVESLTLMAQWATGRAEPPHPTAVKLDFQQHFGPKTEDHSPS